MVLGDTTQQHADAIVNAANSSLLVRFVSFTSDAYAEVRKALGNG
jgi:hypothetical protein